MRDYSYDYAAINSSTDKEPRYVVEISFDDASTDLYYFTSHADAELPVGALSIDGVIEGISGTSQRVIPEQGLATIGTLSFKAVDDGSSVTTLQYNKLQLGKGLRGKRVRVYIGYVGLVWDDYSLVTTQLIEDVKYMNAAYNFNCSDIQRFERNTLFELALTNISATVDIGDTVVNVYNTADFIALEHSNSYSDAPSATVYYFKIENEVIRATGKTATTFIDCTRGVLNTKEVKHEVDTDASEERRIEVEEYVYLELPAPKLAYAILTGKLLGQGTAELPPTWNLGIDEAYVRQTDFSLIGRDLYDSLDDTLGLVLRFTGVEKQDGKKFMEKELLLLMGAFSPVYGDGVLGLKKMVGVLSNSGYIAEINESNVVSHTDLLHDMNSVHNNIEIQWNWLDSQEKFTRRNILIDSESIAKHGLATQINFKFRGLYGNRHSSETLGERFNAFRDRYTGPPLRISVTCLHSTNIYEVGDTVKLKLDSIQDVNTGQPLNRTFEIQNVSVNWINGAVTFTLFGSSQEAGAISSTAATSVIPDAWYIAEGIDLATHTETDYDYTTDYEDIGGVGHIKLSSSITGGADLTDGGGVLGTNSIFYHDGDLVVDDGVTLTISDNIQLRVKGFLTINGTIDGIASGLAGGADRKDLNILDPRIGYPTHINEDAGNPGIAGFLGPTVSDGGTIGNATIFAIAPAVKGYYIPLPSNVVSGEHNVAPSLSLDYSNNDLNGIPLDLRGTSGSSGGNWLAELYSRPPGRGYYQLGGGKGGDGGAGLMIVSRGAAFGVSGKIDLSGGASEAGTKHPGGTYVLVDGGSTQTRILTEHYAGNGAVGAPGALYFAIDGKDQTTPNLTDAVDSNYGAAPYVNPDLRIPASVDWISVHRSEPAPQHGNIDGLDSLDADLSGNGGSARILFVTGDEAAEEDPSASILQPPTLLVLSSGTADLLLNQDGTVTARINASWTAPTDARVKGYNVQYKVNGTSIWYNSDDVVAEVEGYIAPVESGVNYDVQVRSVDGVGNTSDWLTILNYTVIGKTLPPSDVVNFYVYSNGTATVFKWDQVADVDLAGYDIRYVEQTATPNWGDGIRLTDVTRGTNVTSVDVPDGYWTFMIKAVDTSGNYSVGFASGDLRIVSDYDVVTVQQEYPAWSGTFTNMIKLFDNTIMPDDQNTMDSYNAWSDFEKALPTPYTDSYYEILTPIDMLFDTVVRVWSLIQSKIHPLDLIGVADPHADIDYRLDAGSYGGFAQWSIGIINARYVKLRIHVIPAVGIPIISGMQNTVDAIERSESAQGVVIGAGGLAITFATPFHLTPFVEVSIQGATALFPTRELLSGTGFTVHVFNSAGAEVGGTIDWKATGV